MTFLLVLPFTQVIVLTLGAADLVVVVGVDAAGAAAAGAGAVAVIASLGFSLMESFAWLKVNPCAVNLKY